MKKSRRRHSLQQSSLVGRILLCLISLILGCLLGAGYVSLSSRLTGLVFLGCIVVLGSLIAMYYSYRSNRIGMAKQQSTRLLKRFYWAIVFLLFTIYLASEYNNFIETYEKNIFGINQGQYVILVNLVIFLCSGLILYQILVQQYSIKNIGKDGIELERLVEKEGLRALTTNTNMVSKISSQLGCLDQIVNQFYVMGYVDPTVDYETFLNLMERILQPVVMDEEEAFIQVLSPEQYENYLKNEKKFLNSRITKIHYHLTECGIIAVNDMIHIKYKLAKFHQYKEEYAYIVLELGELYDVKIGELLYGYLKCFESLYSKYILYNS